MNRKLLGRMVAGFAIAFAGAASAQGVSFKDKTVTIGIGSSTGGGLDTYGRLVARHFGRHIPGAPNVVPSNMPGAGGGIVAGHLYNIAPKDGTFIGLVFPGIIVEPLLQESLRKTYDPSRFNYVGNAHSETLVCFVRGDAPMKTPATRARAKSLWRLNATKCRAFAALAYRRSRCNIRTY
jgi:tripartite-type tricarboxylate transporter receptor subunit TctC